MARFRSPPWLRRLSRRSPAIIYAIIVTTFVVIMTAVVYYLMSFVATVSPPGFGWAIVFGFFVYLAYRNGYDRGYNDKEEETTQP